MSKTEQLKKDVLSLLTDKNAGLLVKLGQVKEGDEAFGALVAYGKAFREVDLLFRTLYKEVTA